MPSPLRKILKILHPEGIPWPGSLIYNVVSGSRLFQAGYELVAKDILSLCPEGRILDIGTGPAYLLLILGKMNPGLSLMGLDISSAMVSVASDNIEKAGLSSKIDIKEGSADSLSFAENSFDAVVSTGSLHHWKNPAAALNEIYRVLRPGGYALIYDIVSNTPKTAIDELKREFGRLRTLLLWLHTFTEPFYSSRDLELMAGSSLFKHGSTRFLSVLCCLTLKKMEESDLSAFSAA